MMDIFVMQHNYRFRYLITIDNEQSTVNMQAAPTDHVVIIYKYEKWKFEEHLLVIKPKNKKSCQFLFGKAVCVE